MADSVFRIFDFVTLRHSEGHVVMSLTTHSQNIQEPVRLVMKRQKKNVTDTIYLLQICPIGCDEVETTNGASKMSEHASNIEQSVNNNAEASVNVIALAKVFASKKREVIITGI
jgi:hypothetical protein